MSDKTDYKRLKKKLKEENFKLFNENLDLRKILKMTKDFMSESNHKEFIKNVKKEYLI